MGFIADITNRFHWSAQIGFNESRSTYNISLFMGSTS